jgi:hypothetical protein
VKEEQGEETAAEVAHGEPPLDQAMVPPRAFDVNPHAVLAFRRKTDSGFPGTA